MRANGLLRFDKKIYSTCVLIVLNMLLLSVLRGLYLLPRGRSLEVSRGWLECSEERTLDSFTSSQFGSKSAIFMGKPLHQIEPRHDLDSRINHQILGQQHLHIFQYGMQVSGRIRPDVCVWLHPSLSSIVRLSVPTTTTIAQSHFFD